MSSYADQTAFGWIFGTAYALLVLAYFVWVWIELHK